MPYLDVSPAIAALRNSPDEFELISSGRLHHWRSRHTFIIDGVDQVGLSAECNGALLAIRPEQQRELAARFRIWEIEHWQPLQINREFAGHFSPRPRPLRLLILLTGRLHRWLLARDGRARRSDSMASRPGCAGR